MSDEIRPNTAVEWLRSARFWNIALRTAHLAATGILLGGHAFDVSRDRLLPALGWSVATGVAMVGLESGARGVWLVQGRGLLTLGKLGLLCTIPCFWNLRVPILLAVVALASIGSHMPARFRYYSILHGEVIRGRGGPGTSSLAPTEGQHPQTNHNEETVTR